MRCINCGWVVGKEVCPCGATGPGRNNLRLPVGAPVVARPGRGPSLNRWALGKVAAHQGALYQVQTRYGEYWCEVNDLLPPAPQRDKALSDGTRVWALFLDGQWYPGVIDGDQGALRHVLWDDGDAMWLESNQLVLLALEAQPPEIGNVVVAQRWEGEYQPARVEDQEGQRFRVVFADGEDAWVQGENLHTFPPCPFHD